MYQYVLPVVHTCMYQLGILVLACTVLYWYVLVRTSKYHFAKSCPGVQDSRCAAASLSLSLRGPPRAAAAQHQAAPPWPALGLQFPHRGLPWPWPSTMLSESMPTTTSVRPEKVTQSLKIPFQVSLEPPRIIGKKKAYLLDACLLLHILVSTLEIRSKSIRR